MFKISDKADPLRHHAEDGSAFFDLEQRAPVAFSEKIE
jgi:hypothetical protein